MWEEHIRNDLQDAYRNIKIGLSYRYSVLDEKVLKLTSKEVMVNGDTCASYVCVRPSSLIHYAESAGSQGNTLVC